MINRSIILLCCILPTIIIGGAPYNALVVNPVADLIGEPLEIIHNHNSFITQYHDIPLCGVSNDYSCPRIAQLLKNDMGIILEQRGDEVLVQIPHLFYESFSSSTKHTTYWSQKKNFITFDQLEKQHIDLSLFPLPLDHRNKKNIVTLKIPYKDPLASFTYSAGTRFVCQKKLPNSFIVHVYNPLEKSMTLMPIPTEHCFYNQHMKSHQEQQKDFIELLKVWIGKQGIIPYVWGGSSVMKWYPKDAFTSIEKSDKNKKTIAYYHRSLCTSYPHHGLDCSGLVLRAAQTCGIPFYFKNTTTIAKYLKPITTLPDLHEGDLIWIPGHIMIVSSIKENKLIEARHYFDDYGKVHEIELKAVFKNIATYAQLLEAIKTKTPVKRLSKGGTITKEFDQLKLLKFASLWTHS